MRHSKCRLENRYLTRIDDPDLTWGGTVPRSASRAVLVLHYRGESGPLTRRCQPAPPSWIGFITPARHTRHLGLRSTQGRQPVGRLHPDKGAKHLAEQVGLVHARLATCKARSYKASSIVTVVRMENSWNRGRIKIDAKTHPIDALSGIEAEWRRSRERLITLARIRRRDSRLLFKANLYQPPIIEPWPGAKRSARACHHRSCSSSRPSAAATFSSVALRGCLTRSICA